MTFKRVFPVLLLLLFMASCGSSRKSIRTENSTKNPSEDVMLRVSETAQTYVGTKYQYGGTTKQGMDCSGLIYTAFLEENISFPRTSGDMARLGKKIPLRQVHIGDLLFFKTNKKKRSVNHVGLVVDTTANEVFFIHSTTSRGVIISSLDQNYWKDSFAMARRVK
ncbi:C40 family peptidase [Salinimicrobium sp. GXAS 041]|uniref:C40 family peptidase n=1 Tax=Salinimicrobium sp. GXAS 041 TaxID=3400806 RepID=UPI003C75D944